MSLTPIHSMRPRRLTGPRAWALAILLLPVVTVAGCATGELARLAPTDRTPGAVGSVRTAADPNGNTRLQVEVEHLAPAENVSSPLTTYVVWIRPNAGTQYVNVGQLVPTPRRTGNLTATTPYAAFEVLVTAETSGTTPRPSEYVVLRGNAARR